MNKQHKWNHEKPYHPARYGAFKGACDKCNIYYEDYFYTKFFTSKIIECISDEEYIIKKLLE